MADKKNMWRVIDINTWLEINQKNIFLLKKWLSNNSFEKLIESFGEEKSESMDIISVILSESKIKISDLEKINININNILDYDERDFLNPEILNVVSKLFLEKMRNKWKNNLNFIEIFDSNFGEINNIKNRDFFFKDLNTRIDEFWQKFPNIVNQININNEEIFKELKNNWYNINKISAFDKQNISDQKIVCEILYWQNKNTIKKSKEYKAKINNDMNDLNNLMENNIFDKKNSEILKLEEEKDELYQIGWKEKYIDQVNKNIRKERIKEIGKNPENDQIIEILEKLIKNKFNFCELSEEEQNLLIKKYIEKNLLNIDKNLLVKSLWIDEKEYKDFVEGVLDFEKNEQKITIPLLDWNQINLNIKKWFIQWPHLKFLDAENFKNTKDLPIYFDINIEENNEHIISLIEDKENVLLSTSKNRDWIINTYLTKSWEIRLWNNYEIEIKWTNLSSEQLDKLYWQEKDELEKSLKEINLWEQTKDIFYKITNDSTLMGKLWESWLSGSIFEEIMKELNIKIISRNIKLDWNNIDKISLLYVMWNSEQKALKKIKNKIPEKTKKLLNNFRNEQEKHGEDIWEKYAKEIFEEIEQNAYEEDPYYIFNDAKIKFDSLNQDGKKRFEEKIKDLTDEQNDIKINELSSELLEYLHGKWDENFDVELEKWQKEQKEEKETEEEKFMKERECLWWNNFEWSKDKWFRIWTRLFINGGWSKLPPKDKEDSFFEFEIINITNWSFQVKVIWNELESDEVGQKFWLPKTQEHLSKMKLSGDIYRVDKLKTNDRDSSIENIISSKFFNKLTVFGTQEWQIKLKDGKLLNNEWQEIVSLWRSADVWSWEEWTQKKEHTTYKIKKIDNSKWKIKIVCNFEWQDQEDLSKSINYKYDRELTYEQFIVLIESKKIRGYTKNEQEEREVNFKMEWDRLDQKWYPNRWVFNFYSLSAFANTFKNWLKKIKDGLKKIEEDQTEDFENLLYSRDWLNLYSKLGNLTSMFWIFPGTAEAFDRAQLEFYNERDNKTWKKIEVRYKMFEADPHFASMWWAQMEKLLTTPGYIWKDKNRHKTAAAFLMLMKKDWPYGRWWLLKYMGKWHWVEKFLGKEHLVRYKNMLAERKTQLEEYKDINHVHRRKTRQEELNRLEFDYMVWVIDGRQPFGWLKNDDEFIQASIRSRKFATTLDEHSKSYFSSFKKRSDEIGTISFRQAEQEYFRMISAGRIQKALPFLKRIMEDAQNKEEEWRAKMYFLWAMMSWLFKNGQDANVMTEFWTIARTMWLLPGIWCRDTDQADKVQKLLDGITSKPPFEKFSKATWYKKADFEPWTFSKEQEKMPFLSKDLPKYRKKYWNKILDILEFRDMESENSIINLAEKWDEDSYLYKNIIDFSRESTKEDINKNVSYTYWYYTHSPWTANKWVVEWLVPKNWDYKWKETIEIESAQEFWKSVWSSFNTWKQSNKWIVEFYLWKFYNWFDSDARDQSSVNFMMRWLSLVKKLKENWKHEEAKYNLWYLIKWNLHEKLWSFPGEFGTVVDKFVEFFDNNVEMIDDKMVKNIFGDEAASSFNDSYWMLNWKMFYNKYMAYEWFGGWKEKSEYQKQYKRNEENYINWKIDNIKKNLKRKSISWQPIAPDTEEEVAHKTWLLSRMIDFAA